MVFGDASDLCCAIGGHLIKNAVQAIVEVLRGTDTKYWISCSREDETNNTDCCYLYITPEEKIGKCNDTGGIICELKIVRRCDTTPLLETTMETTVGTTSEKEEGNERQSQAAINIYTPEGVAVCFVAGFITGVCFFALLLWIKQKKQIMPNRVCEQCENPTFIGKENQSPDNANIYRMELAPDSDKKREDICDNLDYSGRTKCRSNHLKNNTANAYDHIIVE
ncbi:hypothetical protein ScPMuIL_009431 [Solemya velum]